jgi:signal transduction histidine kinase
MNDRADEPGMLRRRGWLVIFGVWTVFGLIAASQQYLFATLQDEYVAFWRSLVLGLAAWWYYAAATPVILRLGRAFPLERRRLAAAAVHLAAALALAVGHAAVVVGLGMWLSPPMTNARSFAGYVGSYLTGRLTLELLAYLAILGVGRAVEFYRRMRERELTTARLEAALAQAQLQALKMQLHPHFLFNTLHAISVLIREDPAAATRTVTLLGDLLRHTLAHADTDEVPLARELEFLQLYLEIERTRFQDRLSVSFDVTSDALGDPVPQFILQPLVENAVRYGISRRAAPGRIVITGGREGGRLRLSVWNDGPGLGAGSDGERPGKAGGGGIGLATTRGRLEKLYGARGAFVLRDMDGGVEAAIEIPVRSGTPA